MENNKKDVNYFHLQRTFVIKNAIKNGLDTSRLVNLIICFDSPNDFRIEGFSFPPNLFYIHEISFNEAVGILIEKFNFNQKQAIFKVKEWKKEFGTNEIKRDKISEQYEEIVQKTNEEIVENKGEAYKIGRSDIKIIAGFLKEKINIVHVKDKGFEETCKKLGINIIETPEKDLNKEIGLKKKLAKKL